MSECCCERKKIRSEEDKKKLNNRLNRIIGQLQGIKKMIDDNKYCGDILIQLAASDKALRSLSNVILEEHMHTCLVESINSGETKEIDEILDLFRRFS